MKNNNLDVDIFSIFVKKVLQEMAHRFVSDVATNDNMPAG